MSSWRSFHVVCRPDGDCMIDADNDESWDADPGEIAAWAAAYNIPIYSLEGGGPYPVFYLPINTERAQVAFKLRWEGLGDGGEDI